MSQNKILKYLRNQLATLEDLTKAINSSKIESQLSLLKKKGLVTSQEVLDQYQRKYKTYYFLKESGVEPPNCHHCKNTLVCKEACKIGCAYYKSCWEKTNSEYLWHKKKF